jgi:SNF2 family DNA or RNA helicase
MQITFDNDFVYVKDVSSSEKHYLENQLQATYSKTKGYRIPLNIWSLRELWNAFKEFRQSQKVWEVGSLMRQELDRLVGLRKLPLPPKYHDSLREYQNADIDYLKEIPCAGVFNEPRTGKTPTMINLVRHLKPHRTIIVTPASLVYNWQREFEKWYPKARVTVASGNKAKRRSLYNLHNNVPLSVLIVSKDTLKLDINDLQHKFDVAIVDEAHFLRNYKTAQSKAVFRIKADRRYALTGTPTVKHAADIFGILHFLYPTKFPSYWQFAERYFELGVNYMGHSEIGSARKNRMEELQSMVGIMSVNRKRRDIMQWLPDKQYTTFYCKMSDQQKKLYTEMLQYFSTSDDSTELDAPSVLAQLTRLRQLCLDPSLVDFDCPSGKTDALVEYVYELNEPVVIMSMFSSYLDKLENIFAKDLRVAKITGIIDSRKKQEIAEKFQRGEIDVLLCNIISSGTGFTLDKAETIIFTDKAWNPADNEQAEDRITPTTEHNVHKHHIVSFVCKETVDERINTLLEEKKSITDLINEGGLSAIKKLLLST